MKKIQVQLLLTGNEILAGDVIDSNSAMIASELKSLGLEVSRRVAVKDDLELLTAEIINQSKLADILIIYGGLGPTVDDMTAQALAQAASLPLVIQPQALNELSAWCDLRGYELNQANKKQAILPQGCDIIHNRTGSACGFHLVL
ncbi:MAG: damage-inducible protein CinA, partial [Gammaproteobacteria bacterium]|nr:damage-inducible protein CinA [Gammaproteobacteria bacterium]